MKNKNKNTLITYLFLGISLFYMLVVLANFFIPNSELNIWFSSKLFIAQFLAFPFLFGAVMLAFTAIMMAIINFRKSHTVLKSIISIIVVITSIIFMLSGINSPKAKEYSYGDTFKIVEWNALKNLDKDSVNQIFKKFDADIAVFPELDSDISQNSSLFKAFSENEIDINLYDIFTSSGYGGHIAPVTIISKKENMRLAEEELNYGVQFGTVKVKNEKIEVVGLHTAPPIPGLMFEWNLDLETIYKNILKENPEAILIGDFNATLRHGYMSSLENHVDVLSSKSILERGTWPQKLPMILRSSIDHILLPKEKYAVKSVEVVDLEGSDHAAIFTEIGIK